MGDLASALNTAFDEEIAAPASTSSEAAIEAEAPATEARETTSEEPDKPAAEAAQPASKAEDEPTGDVLLDKLTPDQIAEIKRDPKLKAIYKGLMQSYTPKMQQLSEQQRLWEALNNPQTQRQAIEALAKTVGLQIQPHDLPQRDKAAEVADTISDEWSKVVGPEAAQLLRPLIEKTALAAVKGTIEPVQQVTEALQLDARSRQAEAQVSQFRSAAQKNGWELSPAVEAKMAELGQQILPAKPIESVADGVKHLERLYQLATADGQEAQIEKRILERMNKAAQSAEPSRGVPSTGREKRSNVTPKMSLNEALDVAMQEALAEAGRT